MLAHLSEGLFRRLSTHKELLLLERNSVLQLECRPIPAASQDLFECFRERNSGLTFY
jgi:hypothetical protein